MAKQLHSHLEHSRVLLLSFSLSLSFFTVPFSLVIYFPALSVFTVSEWRNAKDLLTHGH